jgi:hypothetical protein
MPPIVTVEQLGGVLSGFYRRRAAGLAVASDHLGGGLVHGEGVQPLAVSGLGWLGVRPASASW